MSEIPAIPNSYRIPRNKIGLIQKHLVNSGFSFKEERLQNPAYPTEHPIIKKGEEKHQGVYISGDYQDFIRIYPGSDLKELLKDYIE